MFHGGLLVASSDSLACTNHADLIINQKLASDRKSFKRTCEITAERIFVYDGSLEPGTRVEGVFRVESEENEAVKYFSGIMVSLIEGLARIQLDGELQDDNVQQFLKKIERYEFTR